MVDKHDLHDLPLSEWGRLDESLVGSVVEVEIVCAHSFGVGVRLLGEDFYGHVNSPRVTDGRYELGEALRLVGKRRSALVLAVAPGRQSTLSLRPSDIP